jgi:hypothetical protein
MRGFHNVLQLLSQTIGTDYSSYFNEVRTELYKLYNKYENRFGAVRSQRHSQAGGSTGKRKTAWGKVFGAPGTSIGVGSSTGTASTSAPAIAAVSELFSYLDSDTVTYFDDDFNILNLWHEHKLTYPILSILARDIMYVPVLTVLRSLALF